MEVSLKLTSEEAQSVWLCAVAMKQVLNQYFPISRWSTLCGVSPSTASLPDCILPNGNPQSCNHQSVLTLHIDQDTHTVIFAATHSFYNLNVNPFWACSSSMTEGFMGSFTAFFSPPVSDLMTHISEPPPVWFLITEVLTGNLLANKSSHTVLVRLIKLGLSRLELCTVSFSEINHTEFLNATN